MLRDYHVWFTNFRFFFVGKGVQQLWCHLIFQREYSTSKDGKLGDESDLFNVTHQVCTFKKSFEIVFFKSCISNTYLNFSLYNFTSLHNKFVHYII